MCLTYFWVDVILSLSFSFCLNFLIIVLLCNWDLDNFSPVKQNYNTLSKKNQINLSENKLKNLKVNFWSLSSLNKDQLERYYNQVWK